MKNYIFGILLLFLIGMAVNVSYGATDETKKTEIVNVDLDHTDVVAVSNENSISNNGYGVYMPANQSIIFVFALNDSFKKYNDIDISPGRLLKKQNCIRNTNHTSYKYGDVDVSPGRSKNESCLTMVKSNRYIFKPKYCVLNWYRYLNKSISNRRNC